tara:strand:+ start:87 stop:1100 length:1014 start_codon:yes stop_codon:yes gene_type:complete
MKVQYFMLLLHFLTSVVVLAVNVPAEEAPREYKGDAAFGVRVVCEIGEFEGPSAPELTVRGAIAIVVRPDWAPLGAERFLELVRLGFYNGTAMFRVIPGFLAQFGMSVDRTLQSTWGRNRNLVDDPKVGIAVRRGSLAYGGYGTNSRSTQVWIAYKATPGLGRELWETPFAHVESEADMKLVASFNAQFGDKIQQGEIWSEGYSYLRRGFGGLTYFGGCAVAPRKAAAAASVAAAAAARAVLAAKAARALAAQPMPAGALAAGGAPLTGNFGSGGAGAGALLPSVEEPAVPQQWLGGRADPAFYTLLLLLSLAGCGLCTACHVVLRCLDGESQQKRS